MKIYIASKLANKTEVEALALVFPQYEFMSYWTQYVGKVEDSPENATLFWLVDEACINSSDVVIVYAKPDDVLRGALVEAGMAIVQHKDVIVLGSNPGFGTWQYHPSVIRATPESLPSDLAKIERKLLRNRMMYDAEGMQKEVWSRLCPSSKQTN